MCKYTNHVSPKRRCFSYLASTLFLIIVALIGLEVKAHPYHHSKDPQLVLFQWVDSLRQGNSAVVESMLSKNFKGPFNQNKENFIAFQKLRPLELSLQEAVYEKSPEKLKVSQLQWQEAKGGSTRVYDLVLQNGKDGWKITSLLQTHASLPFDLSPHQKLPETALTFPVDLSLRDKKTDEALFARVRITDQQGEYWPPRGHQKYILTGFREDIGRDIKLDTKTYAYVKPNFTVELPLGKYEMEVVKGIEYTPVKIAFEVKENTRAPIVVKLNRLINMKSKGWYSGDTHVHFYNAHNALLDMQAEGLNVVNVLATKWGELMTDVESVIGAPSPVSLADRVVYFNEETRHGFLGHTILHPIKELIYPLTWGESREGVPGGFDYPAMAHQADKAHAQGGLVTWAHLFPSAAGELAIDVALGKIDSVDVFTWGNAFQSPGMTQGVNGDAIEHPSAVEYWYKFLNTGFQLPITAGTDKMWNTQVVGSVRTYVYTGKKNFHYNDWIEAIRQGRTFATTGPLVEFTANGKNIGSTLNLKKGDELSLEAVVNAPYQRYPWARLEIVQNGKVIATHTNPKKLDSVRLNRKVKLEESAWFAVRVYAKEGARPLANSGMNGAAAMAHTSPIYVALPNSTIWSEADARFLAAQCDIAINWAKKTARYHTEDQRKEIVSLFERAKKVYGPIGQL